MLALLTISYTQAYQNDILMMAELTNKPTAAAAVLQNKQKNIYIYIYI